ARNLLHIRLRAEQAGRLRQDGNFLARPETLGHSAERDAPFAERELFSRIVFGEATEEEPGFRPDDERQRSPRATSSAISPALRRIPAPSHGDSCRRTATAETTARDRANAAYFAGTNHLARPPSALQVRFPHSSAC